MCFFQALQSSAADVNQLFHKRGKQFMGIDSMGFLQILQSSAVDANQFGSQKEVSNSGVFKISFYQS